MAEPTAQPTVADKTCSVTANLAQPLPTGTLLAFQALAPSFARRGASCYATDRFLTIGLVIAGVVSCAFFALSDSLVGRDGKLYYGLATIDGAEEERPAVFRGVDMGRYRLRPLDAVHAVFTALVFLAIAFSRGVSDVAQRNRVH